MKATESVQITLQLLKYVMYAGVRFPNDWNDRKAHK